MLTGSPLNRKHMSSRTHCTDISVTVPAASSDFPAVVYSLKTTGDNDLAKIWYYFTFYSIINTGNLAAKYPCHALLHVQAKITCVTVLSHAYLKIPHHLFYILPISIYSKIGI